MAANPFHLGWFLGNSYGVHGWNQQWGGAGGGDWTQPDIHIELAKAVTFSQDPYARYVYLHPK